MNKVSVLDCTLRDGGYVNNWEFGEENIHFIRNKLDELKADILELGFMRDEPYHPHRSIFNSVDQVADIIGKKRDGALYAVLVEMANYFPPELLAPRTENGPDFIRYSFWMRCIDEAYEYASQIVDKGYNLGVQPTRVEQYSENQYAAMCERFSKLKPYAIYIVDTFGLLTKEQLIKYAKIADEYVDDGIKIGYHAHNNMQQAFSNATTFAELGLKHDIVIDASVYGMGRGAGNLNLEMLCHYLDSTRNSSYDIRPAFEIWDKCLKEIHSRLPWGYNLEYFIAASNQCNPNYASYFMNKNMSIADYSEVIRSITGDDKFLYSDKKAEDYYRKLFLA